MAENETNETNSSAPPPQASPFGTRNAGLDYDVLIVGAGLSGICAIHRMVQMGLRARVLEAGASEGGTWFWNRYPGARFDSESYSYGFSFAPEILAEWDWTEHFAAQPETLRYAEFVTRRLDLRRHMQFDTRVTQMHFDEGLADGGGAWRLQDQHGRAYTARFVITAMGILNEPALPPIPGLADFRGDAWHTARWPAQHVTATAALAGRRVGVVGTGATGIQTIQTIAPVVGALTVFQRTANWTAPLRNAALGPAEQAAVRAAYPAIFAACARSPQGFVHACEDAEENTLALPPDERSRRWEALFRQRGFSKTLGVAADVAASPAANALYSAFHAEKIRARVRDPAVAALLVPRTHGFGTRRVPLETDYYEAFNRPNVRLVDVAANPIARVTADGLQLRDGSVHGPLDVLVFATGFDAVTGSLRAVDIRGIGGRRLFADVGEAGPGPGPGPDARPGLHTLLGLAVPGFPNLFMVMGPHQMFGNIPRSIEHAVDWTARFLAWLAARGRVYAAATPAAAAAWTAHVHACAAGLLASDVDSWLTGASASRGPGQPRAVLRYTGPAPQYRARCDAVRAGGYREFDVR